MPLSREALEVAAQMGRQAWPDIVLTIESFAAHLRACGADAQGLSLFGSDLYFAAACAQGDKQALRLFDTQVVPVLDGQMARLGVADGSRDEVWQHVRVALLTGKRTIIRYSGRSPLLVWLRRVIQRAAGAHRDARAAEQRSLERYWLQEIVVSHPDPEVAAMRNHHGADFQRALDDSLAALSDRSKDILRMHYLGGLNIDAIAAAYNVHRATVARWLSGIRSVLLANVRARLAETVRPTSSAFQTLVTAMRDEVRLDFPPLQEGDPGADDGARDDEDDDPGRPLTPTPGLTRPTPR